MFFISLFEATLQEKIALAILMPVVASMGGIAGTQTLILVTRGIATGRITNSFTVAVVLLSKRTLHTCQQCNHKWKD
jgi:Mg/Co/Ni transporter MgtE